MSNRRRGIYILPNLFTTFGLFCGFYSIIASIQGEFESAAIAIFVALVADGLDGRVARLTNTQSDFGAEYDSLTDLVAFGLAPALLMYQWQLHQLHKVGWMLAFIYVAATALRLARFNVQSGVVDKNYFQGLPSPAAAALLAGLAWFLPTHGFGDAVNITLPLAVLLCPFAAANMVSRIRFNSFKNLDFRSRIPFVWVSLIALMLGVLFIDPSLVLFAVFLAYALSGPAVTLVQIRSRRQARRHREREKAEISGQDNEPD